MATHYSILAWRIPWTVEPGGRQSMGLQRVRQIEQLTKSKKISVKCQITQNYLFKEMQFFSISLNTEKSQGISKIMEYISVSLMYIQDLIIWRKIKVKWL